jgi:hypothetical protein
MRTGMNEIREKLTADYVQEHGPEGVTYRVLQIIDTLSSLIADEYRLDAHCKQQGTSYSTTGDKGQQVRKPLPEFQDLLKVRQQKLQYLKQLGLGVSKEQIESW